MVKLDRQKLVGVRMWEKSAAVSSSAKSGAKTGIKGLITKGGAKIGIKS